ncbi:MAG: c-type cytochrome, partial [Trueperaceae bacterium]
PEDFLGRVMGQRLAAAALPEAPVRAAVFATLLLALAGIGFGEGADLYERHCASCHGPSGEGGGPFPSLAGSDVVTGDPSETVTLPLAGRGAMPSFASTLSDDQIADVVNHVRTSWGNDAEEIEADLVAEVRAELGVAPGPEEPSNGDGDGDEAEQIAWDEELGAEVYASNCAACHGADGQGIPGAFPAFAGSGFVGADPAIVVSLPLFGRAGMPAFGSLSNEEVAAVVSHIRTSWGNDAGPVSADLVSEVRDRPEEVIPEEVIPDDPTYRPGAAN